MKKIVIVALSLLICCACLSSCASFSQEIGKAVSVEALDYMEKELRQQGSLDTLTRYDDPAKAPGLLEELEEADVALKGEITGVLEGSYKNPENGHWVQQLTIGLSEPEDVETLTQYYRTKLATELEQGKAVVEDGGWMVSITLASVPIETE